MFGDIYRYFEAPRGLLKASALIALAHLAFTLAWPHAELSADSAVFDDLARQMLAGKGFTHSNGQICISFMPMYPLLIAGVYKLFGAAPVLVLCLQSTLAGVIAGFTYQIAEKLFDRRVAAAAFLLIGLLPGLFVYGLVMAAELLVMTLLAAFLNAAIPRPSEPLRAGRAALAGFVLALLALAKPEFCLWGLGVGLVAYFRNGGLVAAAKPLAVAGVVCLLTLSPWFARNTLAFHRFIPFSAAGGRTLWPSAHKPDFVDLDTPVFDKAFQACKAKHGDDQIEIDRCLSEDAVRMIKSHPGYFTLTIGKRAARIFVGSHTEYLKGFSVAFSQAIAERKLFVVAVKGALLLAHLTFNLAGIAGLFLLCRQRERWLLLYAFAAKTTVHAVVMATPRYGLQISPLLAVGSAALLFHVLERRGLAPAEAPAGAPPAAPPAEAA